MNYSTSIDHELKIIRYQHSGNITSTDIGAAWKELLLLKEFTEHKYNLLTDYSQARFNMKVADIDPIIGFFHNIRSILKGKKQSIIVEDPYSTAGSILFQEKAFDAIGFNVKVFSTEAEALKWLTF